MNFFVIISSILFFLLAIIWTKKDWFNLFIKIMFWVMCGFGVYFIFTLRLIK